MKNDKRAQAIEYAKKNLAAQEDIFGPEEVDRDWIGTLGLNISDLMQ